jgi:hypothetical protein
MPVTVADECRHPVEHAHNHWSDSLYFNGFDRESGDCFLTRMAVLPNQPSANALFIAWFDGTPAYGYYRELDHLPDGDWPDATIEGLGYRMREPLQRWTLELDDGDTQAVLEFEGSGPCFDYADNPAPLPQPVAWGHYEQSGTLRGELRNGERRVEFDGVGQRDHSWGWRDWSGVREWHWVTGLFGAERACNLFQVVDAAGSVSANGYVLENGVTHSIVRADRRTREGEGRVPEGYDLSLEVAGGGTFEVSAERSHTALPLQPGTTIVQEAPMRLVSDGRAGAGIYELLFNERPASGPNDGAK